MGWELNERGKPGPRIADLGSTMDPANLAMASADLNVKLMRWRMLPDLDTDGLKESEMLVAGRWNFGLRCSKNIDGLGSKT